MRALRRTRPGPRLRAESATTGSTVTCMAEPASPPRATLTRSRTLDAGGKAGKLKLPSGWATVSETGANPVNGK